MSARSKGAKKRVVVVRRSGKRTQYSPPKLPEKPPVAGSKRYSHYGKTKRGDYIIPRFIITPYYGKFKTKKSERWWVIDMKTANVAKKTDAKGYEKKAEAKEIAESYRDRYGAWATIPF